MQPAAGRQLTVRQMEYIVAVDEWGNMSRAASFCLVSQPSLAEQIAVAERTLGVQLFMRGKRKTVPTVVGEAVVQACREALRAIDDVSAKAKLGEAIRVGAIDTVAPYLFGPWMRQMRESSLPRMIPVQGKTRDLIEKLREGQLDAIVTAESVQVSGVMNTVLGEDPLLLASPGAEKPLKGQAGLEDLMERDIVLLSEGHCLRDSTVDICRKANLPGDQIGMLEASSIEVLVEMVANGLGSTLVPAIAAPRFMGRRDLKLAMFRDELVVKRELVMSSRKDHPLHKVITEVAGMAAKTIEENTAAVREKLQK